MEQSSQGKWRKSKVESFIRRHLNFYDLGVTRYYEMCMWDNKGTFAPSYAILMDSTILLTENPPKSLVHRIPLATIQDISLIADRHSLIRGKNNNSYICQHIAITFETSKNKKNKEDNRKEIKETESKKNDDQSRRSRSSPSSSLYLNDDEDKESSHSQIYQSIASSLYSEVSLSPAPPSSLNESFGSSLMLNGYQQHSLKLSNNGNSLIWIKDNENINSTFPFKNGDDNKNGKDRKKGLMKEVNYEVNSRSSHASSPEVWLPEECNLRKKERHYGVPSYPTRTSTSQRNNGMHEEKTRRKLNEGLINRQKLNHDLKMEEENSNKSGNTRKKKGINDSPKQQRKKQQVKVGEKVQEIHLYFYQRDSEFLNEVSLVWNRQQLKNTEKQDDQELGFSKVIQMNKSIRMAEKVANQVAKDWRRVDDEDEDRNGNYVLLHRDGLFGTTLLRKVGFLHKCLMRYENLKYFCWKNTVIMSGLINAVTICLEPFNPPSSAKYSQSSIAEIYLNKLATYTILMEIFRTLFEACSLSWFKEDERDTKRIGDTGDFLSDWESDNWNFKLTAFQVTQKLMISILKCPFLPQDCNIVAQEHSPHSSYLSLIDSREYAKGQWLTLTEEDSAKVSGLICTAHNASVALLFELLAMSHFLPKFIEQELIVNGTQQMNLEHFVRLSVTQIINILWSNKEPLNASQTMVLYRQVWNLRTLIKYDGKILNFIRQNFSEEFHYYVRSKGIKSRIPDKYTIKYKLIDDCEKLCEDIVSKQIP